MGVWEGPSWAYEGAHCRDAQVLQQGSSRLANLEAAMFPRVPGSCLLRGAGGPGLQLLGGRLQLHPEGQILPAPQTLQEHREARILGRSLGSCSLTQEGGAPACSIEQEAWVCS